MARKQKQAAGPTHYELLGVTRVFTSTELLHNWRALSRELHPDRTGNNTPEGNDAFAAVSQAYAVLSDPVLRRAYDAKLDLLTTPCSACSGAGATYKQKGFGARLRKTCDACNGTGRAPC